MLELKNYHGKKIGILGMGISGKALFESLKKAGAQIFLWDDKLNDEAYGAYKLDPTSSRWQEVEELVISPGIQHQGVNAHPLLKNLSKGCKIYCDVELFYKCLDKSNKTIAITGTNGKSTVTALTNHILQQCGIKSEMCGNIGIPVSSIDIHQGEAYVVELSSYQLDKLIDAKFNIAVLTNITPDHLEMHGDMHSYVAAKAKIFERQAEGDFGIMCIDNEICNSLFKILGRENIIPVSKSIILAAGISLVGGYVYDNYFTHERAEFKQPEFLSGAHNSENIVCAVAACLASGLNLKDIIEAICSFKPLEHRLEYVGTHNGVKYVNDSKGTNFDSTRHALAAYQNIHWIAGGKAKEGGIDGFGAYIDSIKHAYLIGSSQDDFAEQLGTKIAFTKCDNLENAFNLAAQNAIAGDVVLLSPAAASLDQWKNFEERGRAFKEFFRSLK